MAEEQRVLDDDWRGWLRQLERAIRGHKRQITRTGKVVYAGSDSPAFADGRKLSFEEWGRVRALIREHDLIVVPRNACMGFGCAITLYEESVPIYPTIPPMPKKLIDITQEHLPGLPDEGRTFHAAWEEFAPFIETDRNKARAKQEGLGVIREKHHYDY
jgi:hypothetical protein